MLETEIKNLNETILKLIDKLDTLSMPAPAPAPVPAKKEIEKESVKKDVIEVKEDQSTVTEQELVELCLDIVKEDRSKKSAIKQIISGYGGDVISDIDSSKYNDLKTDLGSLK